MQCRLCNVEMLCRPHMQVTCYECPDCGGLWFNSGELDNLIRERVRLALSPVAGEEKHAAAERVGCPVCGEAVGLVPMTSFASRKVRVLGCTVCFGHWLHRERARDLVSRLCGGGPLGWFKRLVS